MQLVDEEDDLALGRCDLREHGLEPLLELAAVLRPAISAPMSSAHDALALQALWDVARDDALSEPFDDRGLADAGLADQNRVVLRAPRQHLDRAADLLVATDDRIELPGLGERGEVPAVLLERLVLASGSCVVTRCPPRTCWSAASRASRGTSSSASRRCSTETYRHRAVFASSRRGREARWIAPPACGAALPPDRRLLSEARLGLGANRAALAARALDERARQLLVEKRDRQVVRGQLGVAQPARELLRARRRPRRT